MAASTSDEFPESVPVEDITPQRPEILEALGSRVAILTHLVVRKARNVPIAGRIIGYVEDKLSPWAEPVIARVEKDGMYLLSVVDNQINTVSDVAMAHSPLAAKVVPQLQTILSGQPLDTLLLVWERVRARGVIGSTADIWVEYEPIMKNKSESLYNLANRVPCLNVVLSFLLDISSPFMQSAVDWLVMHSETKDKHEILLTREVSLSSLQSPDTPDKDSERDEPKDLDFNELADASDSGAKRTSDFSYADAVKSTEVAEKDCDEIGAVKKGEPTSDASKGKFPELTVAHVDQEEDDEVTYLFDTWGMGVTASRSNSLKSLRSMPSSEWTGSKNGL